MIYQVQSQILANQKLGQGCHKLILSSPLVAQSSRPGHFVHIRVNPFPYPLLRRAFSVYDTDGKETIAVVFKVVGTGTLHLSQKKPGEKLDILGPLGNNFTQLEPGQIGIMVAGGLGIVPVYFYAKVLQNKNGNPPTYFLYGAKDRSELYCLEDTDQLKAKLFYSTDNGSYGFKGYLTQLLEQVIGKEKLQSDRIKIYACGPEPMLARLSDYAVANQLFCELSLEVGMPCGMGTCMGCVVKCRDGQAHQIVYRRVCCEGPIFKAGEVIFD